MKLRARGPSKRVMPTSRADRPRVPAAPARRRLLDNRLACVGGLAGTLVVATFVTLALGLSGTSRARVAPAPPRASVPFEPGEIIRLGPRPVDAELPQKIIVDTREAAPSGAMEAVTSVARPPLQPRPKRERERDSAGEVEDGRDRADVQGNNAFQEPPTMERLPGAPEGRARGWSARLAAGDPWATEVMARLNAMRVGVYAGRSAAAVLRFRITVCEDGRVGAVKLTERSGEARVDRAVVAELKRLELPAPPSALLKGSRCARLRYQFSWGVDGVR